MENNSARNKVTMLGLSYCLYSKGARLYLEKRNVDFVYIDVNHLQGQERDEAEAVLARLSPSGALPLTVVGDGPECIVGYDRKKLQEALEHMPLRPPCAGPEKVEDSSSARHLALAKLHTLLDKFPTVHNVANGVANVAGEVKNQLGSVAGEVRNQLGSVAGEVRNQLGNVAGEVKTHIGNVASEVKSNIPHDKNDDTPLNMF